MHFKNPLSLPPCTSDVKTSVALHHVSVSSFLAPRTKQSRTLLSIHLLSSQTQHLPLPSRTLTAYLIPFLLATASPHAMTYNHISHPTALPSCIRILYSKKKPPNRKCENAQISQRTTSRYFGEGNEERDTVTQNRKPRTANRVTIPVALRSGVGGDTTGRIVGSTYREWIP